MLRIPPRYYTAVVLYIAFSTSLQATEVERFSIVAAGEAVGKIVATEEANRVAIDFDLKDNGRGPTQHETLQLGQQAFQRSGESTVARPSAAASASALNCVMASRVGNPRRIKATPTMPPTSYIYPTTRVRSRFPSICEPCYELPGKRSTCCRQVSQMPSWCERR